MGPVVGWGWLGSLTLTDLKTGHYMGRLAQVRFG